MHCIILADRDIFADLESLILKMISSFIVFFTANVVMERPRSTRAVDEMAYRFVFGGPETHHAAIVAVTAP